LIDETWTATNMTRSHGRCPRGERLRMGLRMSGMVAPMVLDGSIKGDWFEAYVTEAWCPTCCPVTSSSWTTSPATSGLL
jgi:hypothetical protein